MERPNHRLPVGSGGRLSNIITPPDQKYLFKVCPFLKKTIDQRSR